MRKLIAVFGIFWIVVTAAIFWVANYKPKPPAPQAAPPVAAAPAIRENVTCIPASWTLETTDAKGKSVRQHVATWGPDKEHPVAFCFMPNGELRWLVAGQPVQSAAVEVGTKAFP